MGKNLNQSKKKQNQNATIEKDALESNVTNENTKINNNQKNVNKIVNYWNKLNTKKKVTILVGILIAFVLISNLFKNMVSLNNPYMNGNNDYSEEKDFSQFKWDDIFLKDIIPEIASNTGKIKDNSKDYLSLEVANISESQYNNYVDICKKKGFSIEIKQISGLFSGYNQEGYKLELEYNIKNNKMSIKVNAPMKLEEIEWPDNKYAKAIPKPKSMLGKIDKADDKGFIIYIGNTSKEDLQAYMKDCKEQGYTIGVKETETTFFAENEESYNINIEYQGNKVIKITMDERKFDVEFEISCKENLLFSKYDVKVHIDTEYYTDGTIKHGTTEKYTKRLNEGSHYVKFTNAEKSEVAGKIEFNVTKKEKIKITISCTSDKIKAVIGDDIAESLTEEKDNNTTTNSIKVIDVKGQTLDKAKQNLKNAGFTNIKDKSNTGATIWIDSNWTVKEQSIEPGKEVVPSTEILLTCEKEGDSLFNWENDSNEEVLEIDYRTLYKEYDDNEVAADQKYKGKMLQITGEIDDIGKELLGSPYITFKIDYLENVQAVFKRSEESKIANLSKGQYVTVKGKCNGKSLGIVGLKDCILVE